MVAIVRAVVWELPIYIKRKLLLESFFIEYLNFSVPSGKHEFLVRLGSLLLLLVLLIYVLLLLVHLCHLHPWRMGRVGKFSVGLVLADAAQPVSQIFRFKNNFMGSGRVFFNLLILFSALLLASFLDEVVLLLWLPLPLEPTFPFPTKLFEPFNSDFMTPLSLLSSLSAFLPRMKFSSILLASSSSLSSLSRSCL